MLTDQCTSVPISFHRSLHAFTSATPNTTGEQLDHPYIARAEPTHRTSLPVREHWEEIQEQAVVGNVPLGLEHEEVIDPLSPATRFLQHLEEDLFPFHFDFMQDSDGDYLHPHSPSQTIAHILQLGDLQPSFTPITQISTLSEETPTMTPPPQIHWHKNSYLASNSFMVQA